IQTLLQNGFDRPIAGIPVAEGSPAGGVKACCAIRFGQANDALTLPQEVEVVLVEQLADGGVHVRSQLCGLLAAPRRRALEESCLLGRVVVPIRHTLTRPAA